MSISRKTRALALAGLFLLGNGIASVVAPATPASPIESTYYSERASRLLAEIRAESAALQPAADTLQSLARHPGYDWRTHAGYLETIKSHINAIGDRTAELQRIRGGALPWQQQAITEVTSHAAKVAASTQAAILFLNDHQNRLFQPEYKDHVASLAESAGDMHQTVGKFLEYERTQQKFHQLSNELELPRD
jgi:hypothetical protein